MEPDNKKSGTLVGSFIVLIILVVGAIYIWKMKSKDPVYENNQQQESVLNENDKELGQLEAELNSLDTSTELEVSAVE